MEKEKYSLNKKFYSVNYKDVWFCFNSLCGKYAIVDKNSYSFLVSLKNKYFSISDLKKISGQENIKELLKEYIDCGILIKNEENYRDFIIKRNEKFLKELVRKNKIFFIGFCTTDKCNFNCTYCIKKKCDSLYNKKNQNILRWDKAKNILDQFFETISYSKRKKITIGFTGGEPLLNFKVIKKIVDYTKKNLGEYKKIGFTITTNGSFIDNKIARFLVKNNFVIGISLDGIEKANNLSRKYKNSEGTFKDIIKGIKNLSKFTNVNNKEKIAISTCLSKDNFEFIDKNFLKMIKKLGVKRINLEADLVEMPRKDCDKITRKLFNLYKYGKSIGITIYGYWSKPFFTFLKNQISPVAFCAPLRGEAIAINADGSIQPCVYINELKLSCNKLEKINKIVRYKEFLTKEWKGNLKECKGCFIEGLCLGGCYVSRSKSRKIFNYRCKLNKKMTKLLIHDFLKENYDKIKEKF